VPFLEIQAISGSGYMELGTINMFWYLLLAHFLGDYPFQTDWIVKIKTTWFGLLLHVGVHLLTAMIIMLYWVRPAQNAWVYLMVLMISHLVIDFSKNIFSHSHPQYFLVAYFFDQGLHIISIAAVAFWMTQAGFDMPNAEQLTAVFVILGLVLVTDVWRITERIWSYSAQSPCSPQRLALLRMLGRACLFVSVLSGPFALGISLGLFAIMLLVGIYWCEMKEGHRFYDVFNWFPWRLAGVDITIALLGAVFIGTLML